MHIVNPMKKRNSRIIFFGVYFFAQNVLAEKPEFVGKVPGNVESKEKIAVEQKIDPSSGANMANETMDQSKLEEIVKVLAQESKGEKGVVEFKYSNVPMYLISDAAYDRMRIIAPIVQYEKMSREQIDLVMEANFHKALDARYAVSDGVLYAVFIHPLGSLDVSQIESAVYQVANLALSFGSAYTSGSISYGGRP